MATPRGESAIIAVGAGLVAVARRNHLHAMGAAAVA
jgi:hypothetical protein